jgi:UDP-glucose 4-epimerase
VFLKHRPVLANDRLKTVFGYTPSRTSAEAFEAWRTHRIGQSG